MLFDLSQQFRPIAWDIYLAGGRSFFVGGVVRDALLEVSSKDIDIEVFGLSPEKLQEVLSRHGNVNVVGKSFGVMKLRFNGLEVDFSMPRREVKNGVGHTGFEVSVDPFMEPEEAALRRDFTINAMMVNVMNGIMESPAAFKQDLDNRILRHVSGQFAEDPLRVLRGMQFASRFCLNVASETATMMNNLVGEFNTISRERLWIEWEKFTALGNNPAHGLEILKRSGWLLLFPVLSDMIGVPQTPWWHPEGDVWTHARLATCEAVRIANRDNLNRHDRVVLVLAAMLHDVGKVTHSMMHDDGHVSSHGHAEAGAPLARSFLRQIGAPNDVQDEVSSLIKRHMDHASFNENPSPRTVNRLAQRLSPVTIEQWERLVEADASGRASGNHRPGLDALSVYKSLSNQPFVEGRFAPILLGRDLISAGLMEPGPEMGKILQAVKEQQLDGYITTKEEALEWARNQL